MPSTSKRRAFVGACVASAAWLGVAGCAETTSTPPERLAQARRLAAELRLALNQAADASGRAVLADTDPASVAFANDARRAKETVRKTAEALAPLLRGLAYEEEIKATEEFTKRFDEYDALDRTVLEVAVENSNLKAQALSFGQIRKTADACCRALEAVSAAKGSKPEVALVALRAIVSIREIQVLHAPHIAEANDDAMTRLEVEMDARRASVRSALATLASGGDPTAKASVGEAVTEFGQFDVAHTLLISLSRKNTNVRSLALSLGQGRALFAACDASLRTLTEALAKRGSTATR